MLLSGEADGVFVAGFVGVDVVTGFVETGTVVVAAKVGVGCIVLGSEVFPTTVSETFAFTITLQR